MRHTFHMMIAAGSLMLPTAALAGPEELAECPAECAAACCVDLEQLVGAWEQPELWIGDKAPGLQIAEYIKGDSIEQFEEGQTYVVEFWATWCGPCIAAFPHMSQLQVEYGDKLHILGVNIWDTEKDESQPQRLQRVKEFVADQGEKMGYTVALEQGEDSMSKSWMNAADRNGIPSAFIVNGEGRIAWMGHPMGMDKPLAQIVSGEFDIATAEPIAAKQAKRMHMIYTAYEQFQIGTRTPDGDAQRAYLIGLALAQQIRWDDAESLNLIAWPVLDETSPVLHRDYDFALKLGARAAELTRHEDPMILDTYALALFKTGKIQEAIVQQKKAVQLIKESEFASMAPEFEARLAQFEAGDS